MKHPDYDRAFHETPEYIRSAIELGIIKGKKAEKKRLRFTRALAAAAALVIVLGAATFGASRLGGHPDNRVPGRPLSARSATEEPYADAPTPGVDPTAAPTVDPEEPLVTPEPTPEPVADPTVAPTEALPESDETPEPVVDPTAAATDTAELWDGRIVYTVDGTGEYFHRNAECNGQTYHRDLSASDAVEEGLVPCPNCLPEVYKLVAVSDGKVVTVSGVYCTEQGNYFHTDPECSGMVNAAPYNKLGSSINDKSPCPVCMDGCHYALVFYEGVTMEVASNSTPAPTMYVEAADGSGQIAVSVASSEVEYTDLDEIFPGLDIRADDTVYVTNGGHYFHFAPDCSGLEGADAVTVYDAIMLGKGMCPACGPAIEEVEEETDSADERQFHYTEGGNYYHADATCSGMVGASPHTLSEAIGAGKRHCPVCIGDNTDLYWLPKPENDADTVYIGNFGGYHINPECFGIKSPWVASLGDVVSAGRSSCPVCIDGQFDGGAKCFVNGRHYHYDPDCTALADMGEAEEMYELQAQAAGNLRCHLCAASAPDYLIDIFGQGLDSFYPGYQYERTESWMDGSEMRMIYYISPIEDYASPSVAVEFLFEHSGDKPSCIIIGGLEEPSPSLSAVQQFPEPLYTIFNEHVPFLVSKTAAELGMTDIPDDFFNSVSVNITESGEISEVVISFQDFSYYIDISAQRNDTGDFDVEVFDNGSWT